MTKMAEKKREIGLQILDLEVKRQKLKKQDQEMRQKIGELRVEFAKEK